MRLKYQFVLSQVAGEYFAVPVGNHDDQLRAIVSLNDTGATIFELLNSGDRTKPEIISMLMEKYDIDKDIATIAVESFLKQLAENGMLEE